MQVVKEVLNQSMSDILGIKKYFTNLEMFLFYTSVISFTIIIFSV